MGVPVFCVSHTVRGTCTFGYTKAAGTSGSITVPEGVYWTDPMIGAIKASDSNELLGRMTYDLDVDDGGTTLTSVYTAFNDFDGINYTGIMTYSGSFGSRPAGANTEGLKLYKRLGVSPNLAMQWSDNGVSHGTWVPGDRQEAYQYSTEGPETAMFHAEPSFNGTVWTHAVGEPIRHRVMRFESLPYYYVTPEEGEVNLGTISDNDMSFKTLVLDYLRRGEMVRVYNDKTATTTYVTAAVTSTDTTISVNSGTGISSGDTIWLDGERMRVSSGGGTTTLTVARIEPKAHPKYAPVSKSHVATYVLDPEGDGDANGPNWTPARRAYNYQRYNLTIALTRTWVES